MRPVCPDPTLKANSELHLVASRFVDLFQHAPCGLGKSDQSAQLGILTFDGPSEVATIAGFTVLPPFADTRAWPIPSVSAWNLTRPSIPLSPTCFSFGWASIGATAHRSEVEGALGEQGRIGAKRYG